MYSSDRKYESRYQSQDSSYQNDKRDYGKNDQHYEPSIKDKDLPPQPTNSGIDFSKYDEIPVEVSGRDAPGPVNEWSDIEMPQVLLTNIQQAKYTKPTPVQKYSLSIVLKGRDLMGCAQTGSGKTAAFLLPILTQLLKTPSSSSSSSSSSSHGHSSRDRDSRDSRDSRDRDYGRDRDSRDSYSRDRDNYGRDNYRSNKISPQVLVLAPTRELAIQIFDECKRFSANSKLKCCIVYGGAPMGFQLRELERGCDLIIATPGRLTDIMDRGKISMSQIKYLVLDEADRMLDMGFEPQIRRIVQKEDMPRPGVRRTLMFSATFPKEIQALAATFLHDYIFLTIGRVGSTTEYVTQKFVKVLDDTDKQAKLLNIINIVKGLTLIFVETKKKATMLDNWLRRYGYASSSIHGDREQNEREAALRNFSSGRTPYLIATNVAARGIDISNITHVINYDMPANIDDYVHRIGRTGRAGKSGLSTTFISDENAGIVPELLKLIKEAQQEIPSWLESMRYLRKSSSSGRRGGSNNNRNFGGRDFRSSSSSSGRYDRSNNNYSSSSSNYSQSNNYSAPAAAPYPFMPPPMAYGGYPPAPYGGYPPMPYGAYPPPPSYPGASSAGQPPQPPSDKKRSHDSTSNDDGHSKYRKTEDQ